MCNNTNANIRQTVNFQIITQIQTLVSTLILSGQEKLLMRWCKYSLGRPFLSAAVFGISRIARVLLEEIGEKCETESHLTPGRYGNNTKHK